MLELEPEEPAQDGAPAALPVKPVTLKPRSIGAGTMGADYVNRKANEPQAEPEVPYEALAPNTPAGAHANGTRPAPVLHHFAADGSLPHSIEAEEYLLSCCLIDGPEVVRRANEAGISPASFFLPGHAVIFGVLQDLLLRRVPIDVAVLGEELKRTKQLDSVGGYAFLTRVSGSIPTTAQAGYFIETVAGLSARREILRRAVGLIEACRDPSQSIPNLIEQSRMPEGLSAMGADAEGFASFELPPDGDRSVLLGDRFLNRGDGMVISGQSGMGKSSLVRQMMASWALGRPFHGMKSNGRLRSLEIQAEDSRGDIAEARLSIEAGMKLSDEERAQVDGAGQIVTERVLRGRGFMQRLGRLIARHKPDLVWINPLQAFIEGDVTDARDLGDFLRAGLNGLSGEEPTCAFVIVHHTTKPATGKERADRLWHEEMYGMAGGAEIINWARGIAVLKATPEKGDFNLVLAKRGTRAGVTKEVPAGVGVRDEIVTEIPLRWSTEVIEVAGRQRRLKSLYWEGRAADAEKVTGKPGRPAQFGFEEYRSCFPAGRDNAVRFAAAHRTANLKRPLSRPTLIRIIDTAVSDGQLLKDTTAVNDPKFYLP
jgi:hypothetical protein